MRFEVRYRAAYKQRRAGYYIFDLEKNEWVKTAAFKGKYGKLHANTYAEALERGEVFGY